MKLLQAEEVHLSLSVFTGVLIAIRRRCRHHLIVQVLKFVVVHHPLPLPLP